MNKKTEARLAKLTAECGEAVRDKSQQSMIIWRGDMWAIIGASYEIRRLRERRDRVRKIVQDA